MSAMPSAEVAALLAGIDRLAYPERMRALAERARAQSVMTDSAAVLAELYGGDRFQREIAVFMAVVAGHQPTIAAALADPDFAVQRAAVTAWLRSGPAAAEVTRFVADASWHARRHVYRVLRQGLARRPIADDLIGPVRDRFGDAEAARLLPACSAGPLERLLPDLGYAAGSWSLLGTRHPEIVVSEAERQLAELTVPERAAWWVRFGDGVLAAAPVLPERVLGLLESYAPGARLPGPLRRYKDLAAADAVRLIALMAAPARARWLVAAKLPRSLLREFARLDTATLAPVARRLRDRPLALVALLAAVPPSRRAALYDAAYAGVDLSQSEPAAEILDVLPRTRRWAEAERILGLGRVRDNVALTLNYTTFLPWDLAREPLTEATKRARADDRATGYELLVDCAARTADAAIMTEIIGYLRRIRNEQDRVRARALGALARVSPRLFQPEAAEALGQIASDALAARDAGGQTRTALARLATSVLREQFAVPPLLAWSLRTLNQLFGDDLPRALGGGLGRMDTRLRRGQETEVLAAIAEWLEAGIRRGSYQPLFAIATALGRRAWRLPRLQDMLRRAIDPGNVSSVMRQGISLWLADPAARSLRAEEVLFIDSSTATLPEVWAVLNSRRTDLLDLVLGDVPPRGKFLAAGTRWVPLRAPGAGRWLPRQRAAYAALLANTAGDAGAKLHTRVGAIRVAGRLSGPGWDVVQRYIGSPNTSLAEAALGALAWTDRPGEALTVLLQHSGDDQARVAVYAAGRAARFVPPRQLGLILTDGQLAEAKLTSRKEMLRLAAALSVPGAGEVLRRAWAEQGQHRDIRAAVAAAARQRLHDPVSWAILAGAATGTPEEALAVLTVTDPLGCAPRHRQRYGQLIADVCHSSDQQVARVAWPVVQRWAAWMPDVTEVVAGKLTDLDDRTIWRIVAAALPALLGTGRGGPVLLEVTGQLAALDLTDASSLDPGRDRPAQQRLRTVVEHATRWAASADPGIDRAPLADAGRRLAAQLDGTLLAARLLVAAVLLDGEAGGLARRLTDICDLVADQPVVATRIADTLARRMSAALGERRSEPETLRGAAAILERDGRLAAGLFAVVLAGYGARLGWPEEWRELILRLRGHRVPDVRTAALSVVMAAE